MSAIHHSYDGNILVNAMCVGIAKAEESSIRRLPDRGTRLSMWGEDRARRHSWSHDGLGRVRLELREKRPTVQVGDPFTEKLLIEACLELMEGNAIVAIQDMGAAGLTSSSVEMAGKGGLGIELDLDRVPLRESGMSAYEIMLSESQERMLMILRPGSEAEARRVFAKWKLDFAVIGRVTETVRLVLRMNGDIAADIPVEPLVTSAPVYRRPWRRRDPEAEIDPASLPDRDPFECLQRLLASPAFASKRWIWEQYDHLVMGNTVKRPGGDAAVVRISTGGKASGAHNRLHTEVLPSRSGARRGAGRRRELAQPDCSGRRPAGANRQHEFRQPRATRNHGRIRRCDRGHPRGVPGARLSGRVRECLALQRDERQCDPADTGDRRSRAGHQSPNAADLALKKMATL